MTKSFLPLLIIGLIFASIQTSFAQKRLSINEQLALAVQLLEQGAEKESIALSLDPLYFEENTAALSADQKAYLNLLITYLKKTNFDLSIIGHSDSEESSRFNDKIAQQRLDAVAVFLQNAINASKLTPTNKSDTAPASAAPDKRSKNRRVELILTKPIDEPPLKDLILLNDEETLGGEIVKEDDEHLYYRDYIDGQFYKVKKAKVVEVVYENGESRFFKNEQDAEEPTTVYRKRNKKRLNDFDKLRQISGDVDLSLKNKKFGFSNPYKFGTGAIVAQLGGAIRTNLGENSKVESSSMVVPPTTLTLEVGIFKNIGLSVSGGVDYWREKALEYDYQHYTLGARLSYHFKMPKKFKNVDFYVGGAATHHWLFFENDPRLCLVGYHPPDNRFSVVNKKWTFDPFGGIRVYWKDRWAVYGEIGSDGISHYQMGVTRLLRKHRSKNEAL